MGRFITQDPSRDGLNWYAYCENNPVNAVDPTGRGLFDKWDPLGAERPIEPYEEETSEPEENIAGTVEEAPPGAPSEAAVRVKANYKAGRAFETQGIEGIGGEKNTRSFVGNAEFNGATEQNAGELPRFVETIPDCLWTNSMWEFKDRKYVYAGSQMRAQLDVATCKGWTYNLAIGKQTKLSDPAERLITRAGGAIYRLDTNKTQFYNWNGELVNVRIKGK